MGVTNRALPTERANDAEPWNRLEDEALQAVTRRYGLNWQVASWVVSQAAENGALARERRRSARQCLERWQQLAASNPDLKKAVKKRAKEWEAVENCDVDDTNKVLRKHMEEHDEDEHQFVGWTGGEDDPDDADGEDGMDVDGMEGTAVEEVPGDRVIVNNRFGFLKEALAKKKKPPSIPGVSPEGGGTVPAHASHSNATAAAASQLSLDSGVKKDQCVAGDMWPLQLLETFRTKQGSGGGGSSSSSMAPPSRSRTSSKGRSGSVANKGRSNSGNSTPRGSGGGGSGGGGGSQSSQHKPEVVASILIQNRAEQKTQKQIQTKLLAQSKEAAQKACTTDVETEALSRMFQIHNASLGDPQAQAAQYAAEMQEYQRKQAEYEAWQAQQQAQQQTQQQMR
jgi:phosphopantetheinyl transferase (holo-ACP synthase)